ncbi:hypothetical protein [Cupriavidus campinensis]|uniref:Uncharacterized protein n=1 Tax=Cupriavidus campinensis TaxID=151783 RepID=A0AAE9HXY4_9BURK|nr:hypothetical protein [Cupriavidus campinensis]URF02806.1 hypothetical protein M5D45_09495 [Cupriavidus campinensis]
MTLDERLDNWGRAQRLGGYSGRAIGSAEGRYRASPPQANIERMLIDEKDAEEVERAWARLMPFDKDVLRLYYIWEAPPSLICRRLRIRYRPASVLDLAIAHAKQEIGKALKAICETKSLIEQRQNLAYTACTI